jgi:O-antigen/teichoic acid export membrane protein
MRVYRSPADRRVVVMTDVAEESEHGRFRQPNLKRRLVANSVATATGNIWTIVLSLAAVPILLASLGAQAFGVWALLQTLSVSTGWLSLADAGIGIATARSIAEAESLGDRGALERIVATSLTLFAATGVGAAIVLGTLGVAILPTIFHVPDQLVRSTQLAAVLAGAQAFLDLTARSFQAGLEGLQHVDLARLADTIRRTIVTAATCGVALLGGGLVAVAAAAALSSVSGVVASYALLRRRVRVRPLSASVTQARVLMRYALSVAVLRPISVIHRTVDRMVVGIVLGPAWVAAVEVASSLQGGADALLSATSYPVTPTAAWLDARKDGDAQRGLMLRGTRLSLAVTLPIAVSVAVMSAPFIRVWLGNDAPKGSALLATVGVASIIAAAPVAIASNMLVGVGNASPVIRAALAGIVVNVGLTVLLVNLIGAVGAFCATFIAGIVTLPLILFAALARFDVPLSVFVRKSVVAGAIPATAFAGLLILVRLVVHGALTQLVVGALAGAVVLIVLTFKYTLTDQERARFRRRTATELI